MKILLLNPPFLKNYSRQSRSPCVAKSGTIYFSYYLAYAGCALEQAGFDVIFYDCIVTEDDHQTCLDEIVSHDPDFILMDTSTPSIINDLDVARSIKAFLPNVTLAACGTFPSKSTAEFFKLSGEVGDPVDLVLRGEYEKSTVEVCEAIQSGEHYKNVQGVAYTEKIGEVTEVCTVGEPQKISEEFLEDLPFVSEFYFRHLGEKGIAKHFYASINWPYIQILTSRGCPYKCSFCNIPSIGSYRKRSVENVVEEFKFISEHLPYVKEVFIEDDTFPINKKRTIALCEKLKNLSLGLTWSCNARVNTDQETLQVMRDAGCRLTCVGFESPTLEALDGVIKKTSLDQQQTFMLNANRVGMKVNGCFILGLPGETEQSAKETIKYSIKLSPNTAQFYPHMLYPGTKSFEWAEKEGLIEHKNWSDWLTKEGFHNTPIKINGLDSTKLLTLCDEARMRFYTHPKYLFKMVFQALGSKKEAQRIFIAGKSFFPLLAEYIWKKWTKPQNRPS